MNDILTIQKILEPSVIIGFIAVFVASLSFFVAWRQHEWNKRNHLASVRPFLSDFMDQSDEPLRLNYKLTNKGLGPALVDEFRLTWDDEPISINELRGRLRHELDTYFQIRVGEFNEHFALAAGEEFNVINIHLSSGQMPLSANPKVELESALNKMLMSCRLIVKYRSFLSSEVQTFRTTLVESLADQLGLGVRQ